MSSQQADLFSDIINQEIEEDSDEQIPVRSTTDKKLEQTFQEGRLRVVQDKNDFFLPHVLDFIKGRKWGNLRPEYQRRLRWSAEKKSKLIESFVMNIPVPPVFLFEDNSGQFEVMDGQQRINSVVEFLQNDFALEKLQIWPELNGKRYNEIPPAIRRGLDRAKLSAITLVTDQISSEKSDIDMRAQVFERLNTGGEKLNLQELRNCLFSGDFNDLIVRLASSEQFTKVWGIPSHSENTLSDGTISSMLTENKLFSTMGDCQIVLRFFAFRDDKFLKGSTRNILDECMKRNRYLPQSDIDELEKIFHSTLALCIEIFGDSAFKIKGKSNKLTPSRPLFDSVMIATSRLIQHRDAMKAKTKLIRTAITTLCDPDGDFYEVVVGRPNTADAIRKRISGVEAALREVILTNA